VGVPSGVQHAAGNHPDSSPIATDDFDLFGGQELTGRNRCGHDSPFLSPRGWSMQQLNHVPA